MTCTMPDGQKVQMRAEMRMSTEHMASELLTVVSDDKGATEVLVSTTAKYRGACAPATRDGQAR
jgi:hypothetical protein